MARSPRLVSAHPLVAGPLTDALLDSIHTIHKTVLELAEVRQLQLAHEREIAQVWGIGIGVPAPVAWFPFAGWKDSIDGDLHANGTDAVDFYTRKKVVTSRWA